MSKLKISICCLLSFFYFYSKSQEVYVSTLNTGIYNFIDELYIDKVIDANTLIKPYSRTQICTWLLEADSKRSMLNTRQVEELNFYLRDYYKTTSYKPDKKRLDIFYYTDSIFSVTLNPILSAYLYKNSNEMIYGRYAGAEVYGTLGKNWSYYVNLRDNYESSSLRKESFLTQHRGAVVKYNKKDSSIEWNEINGGISYSWKWGSIGLIKENVEWGSGYNGTNIFSGHSPSFTMIKLKLTPTKWLDFNYFHGWLVSNVVDSSTINTNNKKPRWEYYGKYVAANMFTIKPLKWLDFSFGSSTIYSYRTPQIPYFIPFMFFKAVDHWYSNLTDNTDQNSQMYFDLKVRPIKGIALYSTFFVDEISIKRMFDKVNSSNFISIKGGISFSNLPFKNLFLVAEYTRTNPFAFNHWADVQTYATNKYNFGHYLRDNAEEVYAKIGYKALKNLSLQVEYVNAKKGPNYLLNGDKYQRGDWFMKEISWQRKAIIAQINYQPINDLYINLGVESSNITGKDMSLYTPKFMQGKTTTLFGGINFGF